MKKTKILALALSVVMLLSLIAGCGQIDKPSVEGEAISVTDMTGREVTLEEPATKVVALTAADCEILFAIGAGDTLVGRGEYCDYPAEISDVPAVESGSETNIEQIIALESQVVFMSTMAQTKEQVQQLEDAGIAVVVSEAKDIEGVYDAINIIATMTGKANQATAVIDEMKNTFADLEEKASADSKQTIYFEVSPLEFGLWTAGSGTFMNEIATMLGLTNTFEDVEGWAEISEEQVLERNPDFIVTISMYYGDGPTPTEEIQSRVGWENVSAVKNNTILNLQNNEITRPGPRLAEGAKMMSEFISGEEK